MQAGELLLRQMPRASVLHGDKGYDSNAIRRQVEGKGACQTSRQRQIGDGRIASADLYRNRNAIERMFGRLKDFRRIATRYDRLADNFLAAVCLAAAVSYWISGPNAYDRLRADDVCCAVNWISD